MSTVPSVFLSHSSPDKPFVRWLAEHLRAEGAQVWIDEAEIKIGDSLIEKISEGIDKCEYLVVVLSQKSVNSEWVKRELNIALTQEINGRKVKVLPVVIEKCSIPLFLLDKKYIDFENREFPRLNSLHNLINDIGLDGRGIHYKFFQKFVCYDCYDHNNGFDVGTIQHFRPIIMEKIIHRLWFFKAKIYGMDIAEKIEDRWSIVGADFPDNLGELDSWISLIRQDRFSECILSLSYTFPSDVLDLFIETKPSTKSGVKDSFYRKMHNGEI